MIVPSVLIQCVLLSQLSGPTQPNDSMREGRDQPAMSAKEWIEELLQTPPEGALPGTPTTLMASLRGIRGERRQQEVIDAYWQLSKAVAKYYVAAQVYRVVRTERLPAGQSVTAESMRMIAELQLEAARARIAAVEAQASLAALIRWADDALPLPASRPHVGAYHTYYNEIFGKYPNQEARRLHHLLPNEVALIHAHAEMLNALTSGPQKQPAAAARFRTECGEFLDAVDRYNRNIARYVLLASDDATDGPEIVPMLIKVERNALNRARMATEANGQSSTAVPDRNRSTQIEDHPNENSVIPAHTETPSPSNEAGPIHDDVERSILVQPATQSNSGQNPPVEHRPRDPVNPLRDRANPSDRGDSGWHSQTSQPAERNEPKKEDSHIPPWKSSLIG